MIVKDFKSFLAPKTSHHIDENGGAFFIDRDLISEKDQLLKHVVELVSSASEAGIRAQIVDVSTNHDGCVVSVNILGVYYDIISSGDEMSLHGNGNLSGFIGNSDAIIDSLLGVKSIAESSNGIEDLSKDVYVIGNYLTSKMLQHGEYIPGGVYACANIEYLRLLYNLPQSDIHNLSDFKDMAESGVILGPLVICEGGYDSRIAYLLDTRKNRQLLNSLSDYPIFDEDILQEIEDSWLSYDWINSYRPDIARHIGGDQITIDILCNPDIIDMFPLLLDALEIHNIEVIYEYSSTYIDVDKIYDTMSELVYANILSADRKELEEKLRNAYPTLIYKGVAIIDDKIIIDIS